MCYNINKNLEKQLIKFFRILCMNGNRKMQNFLRKQHTNVKSFNIISIISENASDYIPKLKFAIPFDLFVESILAMTEFIQGPNTDNQQNPLQFFFLLVKQFSARHYCNNAVECYNDGLNNVHFF